MSIVKRRLQWTLIRGTLSEFRSLNERLINQSMAPCYEETRQREVTGRALKYFMCGVKPKIFFKISAYLRNLSITAAAIAHVKVFCEIIK